MITINQLTQDAGALLNIQSLRAIDEHTTRVRYIPTGQRRAKVALVSTSFNTLYPMLVENANANAAFTGHRFADLLREGDGTAYAVLCKVCGSIHKVYHSKCTCSAIIPLTEDFKAKQTATGLELPKQRLEMFFSDIARYNLTGCKATARRSDVRTMTVRQIHEAEGSVWGYVNLNGESRLVMANSDGVENPQPDLSTLTAAGRQWTWTLEEKTKAN